MITGDNELWLCLWEDRDGHGKTQEMIRSVLADAALDLSVCLFVREGTEGWWRRQIWAECKRIGISTSRISVQVGVNPDYPANMIYDASDF